MAYIDYLHNASGRLVMENDNTVNIADVISTLNAKDGLHTTTTENNAIANGVSYVGGGFATTVASTAKSIYHFTTGNKIAILSYTFGSDGRMKYGVYKDPTITANGTEIACHSRNMVTVVPQLAKLYSAPTVTDEGTIFVPRFNDVGGGAALGGGQTGDSRVLVVPPNTSILFIAQNLATTNSAIDFVLNWIESGDALAS